MPKEYIILGVLFVIFKLVTLDDYSLIHNCENNDQSLEIHQISLLLRNISSNITNLTLICNKTINLSINSHLFPLNMTLKSLTFFGFNLQLLPNSFENLINLQSLVFRECNLLYVHIGAFGSLRQLNILDLSLNNITVFNGLSIPKNSQIKYLNLSHNDISFFSENSYRDLKNSINVIDLQHNNLSCHCVNSWINKINNGQLKSDLTYCNYSEQCNESFSLQAPRNISVYSFRDITIDCPITMSSSLPSVVFWISPHNDVFGPNKTVFSTARNYVGVIIQPLFSESFIFVNISTNSLTINNFRGYFGGSWVCNAVSNSGFSASGTVTLKAQVKLKEIFDFSVFVGFSFAGCWLLVAICVGLVQYCRETSCCRHRIDYNKSSLFDRRYARTVIPVPMEDSLSDSGSNNNDNNNADIESTSSRPLNNRARHESHNNDVQLIFTDENLADQYAQMLSDLKEASENDDENFYNRLRDMRMRFSLDFNRMRFDIKRGMESLRSNSTAAAHKLRKGVVHMKDHMKSFTEFCGTASIAQSISIVVIPPETLSNTDEIGNGVERLHKRTVFNFFEPC